MANATINQRFKRSFFAATIVPLILTAIALSIWFSMQLQLRAQDTADAQVQELAASLDSFMRVQIAGLTSLADSLRVVPTNNTERQALLAATQQNYAFNTMILADANGMIIGAAPMARADQVMGLSVADRAYFTNAIAAPGVQISRLFRGRGFGPGLIVALSERIQTSTGNETFVLEGSLQAIALAAYLDEQVELRSIEYLLHDSNDQIIATSERWIADTTFDAQRHELWDKGRISARSTIPITEWHLHVATEQSQVTGSILTYALIIFLATVACIMIGAIAYTAMLAPLSEWLSNVSATLSQTPLRRVHLPPLPDDSSEEVRQFQDSLQRILDALFRQHKTQADNLSDLENLVAERTQSLARTQDDLAHQRTLLRHFIDAAPVAIALVDCKMNYIAASAFWCVEFGLKDEQIVGKCHYDLFPDIPPRWRRRHRAALTGQPQHGEEEAETLPDGTTGYFNWVTLPWVDVDGHIDGLILMTENVTESVKRRLQLQRRSRVLEEFNAIIANRSITEPEKRQALLRLGSGVLGVEHGGIVRLVDEECILSVHYHVEDFKFDVDSKPMRGSACGAMVLQGDRLLAYDGKKERARLVHETKDLSALPKTYIGAQVEAADNPEYGSVCFWSERTRGRPYTDTERVLVQTIANWLSSSLTREHNFSKIAEQSRKLQNLIDGLPMLVAYISRDLTIELVNQQFNALVPDGSSAIGKKISAAMDVATYARVQPLIDAALTGTSGSIEIDRLSKSVGRTLTYLTQFIPDRGTDEVEGLFAFAYNISVFKRKGRDLTDLAETDALTLLPNRRFLAAHADRDTDHYGALVVLDFANLKVITDRHGHAVGERLLRAFALSLKRCCGQDNIACRIGGDEFAIFATGSLHDATEVVACIEDELNALQLDNVPERIELRVGIAAWDKSFATTYKLAEARCRAAPKLSAVAD